VTDQHTSVIGAVVVEMHWWRCKLLITFQWIVEAKNQRNPERKTFVGRR